MYIQDQSVALSHKYQSLLWRMGNFGHHNMDYSHSPRHCLIPIAVYAPLLYPIYWATAEWETKSNLMKLGKIKMKLLKSDTTNLHLNITGPRCTAFFASLCHRLDVHWAPYFHLKFKSWSNILFVVRKRLIAEKGSLMRVCINVSILWFNIKASFCHINT